MLPKRKILRTAKPKNRSYSNEFYRCVNLIKTLRMVIAASLCYDIVRTKPKACLYDLYATTCKPAHPEAAH